MFAYKSINLIVVIRTSYRKVWQPRLSSWRRLWGRGRRAVARGRLAASHQDQLNFIHITYVNINIINLVICNLSNRWNNDYFVDLILGRLARSLDHLSPSKGCSIRLSSYSLYKSYELEFTHIWIMLVLLFHTIVYYQSLSVFFAIIF